MKLTKEVMVTKKKAIDWPAVERSYRTGLKTLRELSDEFGVSHTAIAKKAKRDDWSKDLSSRIRAKTEAKIAERLVDKKVSKRGLQAKKATDREIVNANAENAAEVVLYQTESIKRSGELLEQLMDEAKAYGSNVEILQLLADQSQDEGETTSGQARVIKHMLSWPGRVDSTKKLIETQKVHIELQRKVMKLDSALPQGDDSQNIVIDFSEPVTAPDSWGNEGDDDV